MFRIEQYIVGQLLVQNDVSLGEKLKMAAWNRKLM